jgi:hypothetical protein
MTNAELGVNPADPARMAGAAINSELDKLDRKSSALTDKLIDAGRGYERMSETMSKGDPLSVQFRAVHDRIRALHAEIERRYGPGAPRRLPKGFGPIRNSGRRSVDSITDRAKRYGANSDVPAGPRVCGLCGSRDSLGVGHLDGYEEHGEAENLMWMCKACNSLADAVLKAQGMGRSTNQYNPGIFSGLFRSRETYRTKGGGHPAERAEIRRRAADVERKERAEVRAAEIADRRRALAERAAAPKQVGRYKGTTIYRAGPVGDRYLYSSLDPDSHFDSVRDLKSVVDQFKNPASNLSEWRRAVDVLRGEVDGSAREAVRMIRSTPPARRLDYLARMRPNPDVPSFKQYAWAVTQHQKGDYMGSQQGLPLFSEGAHDEGGAIIHATPPEVRREYAARLAQSRGRRRRAEVPF